MSEKEKRLIGPVGIIAIFLVLLVVFAPFFLAGLVTVHPPYTPASSHFRSIAGAYFVVNFRHAFEIKPNYTAHAIAVQLAKEAGLNDASYYFTSEDPRAPKGAIKTVLDGPVGPNTLPNLDFMRATLSLEIAVNIPTGAPVITTPIAWTRGLREDGTWAPDSPWRGKGGHVAYLDGHIEWLDGPLSTAPGGSSFVKYGTNIPTTNIREALPPGAVILSAEPGGAQRLALPAAR